MELTTILDKVPDAHLYVIGTGQLYGSDNKLGKYGIAEDDFERKIMKYLTDKNGHIIESVSFLGLVRGGYDSVLRNVSVGVVNPIALTETFCTSAIDFASHGIPVVTCGKHGLLSTVINNVTGLTFYTDRGFEIKMIKLLLDNKLNSRLGKEAFKFSQRFDYRKMVEVWKESLDGLHNGQKCVVRKPTGNYHNDWKFFKIINAFIRRKIGFKFMPSSVDYKEYLLKFGRNVMRIKRKCVR